MNKQTQFSLRLADRLAELGWTQADLAKRIGVSQPVVSAYLRGLRSPGQETMAAISRITGLAPAYLIGEQGATSSMTTPAESLSWYERPASLDGFRSYGNARAELFGYDYDPLVRESAQNSNDAAAGEEVHVEYRLMSLSGRRLEDFLGTIGWATLEPHYRAVAADEGHRTTQRYAQALEQIDNGQLWLLRIDDFGTSGLIGPDFESGCFSALTRFSQDSQKEAKDNSAGGRFGLGSAALSAASGLDLILFFSDLSKPIDGRTERRLLGRAVFPFHKVGNQEFDGPFFWGIPEPGGAKRLSAWITPEVQETLALRRDVPASVPKTGTSILIVGFGKTDGQAYDSKTAQEALNELFAAFEKWFWPAVAVGRLAGKFTLYDNDRMTAERTIDANNLTSEYAPLLTNSGDCIEARVSLNVPKSSDGSTEAEHSARLIIQLLPDGTKGETGKVALMRSPLMVVKYRNAGQLALGAQPYRAALLAGKAAQDAPSPAVEAAEAFLAKAEPPAHDDWIGRGTDLGRNYRGGSTRLDDFWDAVKSVLREHTAPKDDGGKAGPEALRRLLTVPGGSSIRKRIEIINPVWHDKTFTTIRATVRTHLRRDRDRYVFEPKLFVKSDTGMSALDFDVEPISGCEKFSNRFLKLVGSGRDAAVAIKPRWDTSVVRPNLSALSIDVVLVERREVPNAQ